MSCEASILLHPMAVEDFDLLIGEIPDARFLLQWGGRGYTYPLDHGQLHKSLENTLGQHPTMQMFKAQDPHTLDTIGHIQLLNIDWANGSCVLGRVLLFEAFRHQGLSKALVTGAVEHAFGVLGLDEITLNVFDFNRHAITTYQRVGFIPYALVEDVCIFEEERWRLIQMKLYQTYYDVLPECRIG